MQWYDPISRYMIQLDIALASLDLSGFLEKLQPIHDILTTLGPATQEAVSQMSSAFGSLDISGFQSALQPVHEILTTLGRATATEEAVSQMSTAFQSVTNATLQTLGTF